MISLTYAELKSLKKQANNRLDKLEAEHKSIEKAKVEIDAILENRNVSLEQVYPDRFKPISKRKSNSLKGKTLPPRWKNPDNPNETTATRGTKPKWLIAAIEKHGEEACKIKESW